MEALSMDKTSIHGQSPHIILKTSIHGYKFLKFLTPERFSPPNLPLKFGSLFPLVASYGHIY
jgi:hypothetical protein